MDTTEACCEITPPAAKDGGYDLAVIGAGSAGFSAAITAAGKGARVALLGHGTIGGTCVNIGCVPSKTLIRAMESLHHARAAQRYAGLRGDAEVTDWAALIADKDALVAGLRQAKYADLLPEYEGIAYREGRARLTASGASIDGAHVRADKIIIATGARPAMASIPGMARVDALTSTSALALTALPRSLLVIGGGYIGCELAQVFARAGVDVTLVCRSRLLPHEEPEISAALTGFLRDDGMAVYDGLQYRGISQDANGVRLVVSGADGAREIVAERVLVATGRRANTEDLGLEALAIAQHADGAIVVDEHMRTTRAGVYAAGDVTGRDQFVYMAAHGAKVAAENALGGAMLSYDSAAMPAVVFTDPQVASAGLTEAAARAQGRAVTTSVLPLAQLPRALAARDTRGLIKLVADGDTGALIGAHILAPEGADSIQTAVIAMRQGMTVSELAATIFPYLTTVEGLKLAALGFVKDVAKLSCCAV